MSFLAPWFLLLGAAAAVPLLLHLLRRRIGTRVEFPAARYLARAEREHSRTLRLRNLLLMMLRVAAVLVVALAAARPATRLLGRGHGPTALAVVLDNSLSTTVIENGHPLFAQLETLARRVLGAAGPGDRVWLVTADGVARAGTASELGQALDHVSPLGGAGDPELALSRAAASVRAAGLPTRQLALITDGQKSTWSGAPATGTVPVIAWVPRTRPPANRAVVSARAEPERWTPRGTVRARVQASDSTTYRIMLGTRTMARGTAAPGEEIVVRAAPPERGWQTGTVELDPDELPGDNVRHFAAWVGPATRAHVAAGAGPFVANAMDVLRGDGRVADGGDVAVVPADELTALPALIVAPSDPVRVGAANRALSRAGVPWQFGAVRRGAAVVQGPGLGDPRLTLRYVLQPTGSAPGDTLGRVGVEPWIVAGPRYVLIASPLTPDASTFPVSAAFVPWVAGVMADRLSGAPGRAVPAVPTQRLAWPSWADGLEGVDGANLPDGEFQAPARAGTYFFTRDGRRVGALVVNPEEQESTLDRWSAADFGRLLGAHGRVETDASRFEASVFDASTRGPMLVPLLAGLLVILIVEGAVAARDAGAHG